MVPEQYRFHMTLSGSLGQRDMDNYRLLLQGFFAPALADRLSVDRVSLFYQPDSDARFKNVGSFPLARSAAD